MNPFDALEKLITEHGSAAVLARHLAFAKDKYAELEKQVAKLEAKLEIEQSSHKETKLELERLKDEHAEEIRIFSLIEFRRGKRTGGGWMAFCPKCHLPAGQVQQSNQVFCPGRCGWTGIYPATALTNLITQMEANQ